jgi:hypothetical protein
MERSLDGGTQCRPTWNAHDEIVIRGFQQPFFGFIGEVGFLGLLAIGFSVNGCRFHV